MALRQIEIFRAGTHTASNGTEVTMTTADLAALAANYSEAAHEAPLVAGHPKSDDPAYGWVKRLSVSGDRLNAHVDDVDPAFAELIRAKRYKNVSASFYVPSAKANPKPGAYYLRHVGFLGAAPPAVRGLRQVEFAGDDSEVVEFGDQLDRNLAYALRSLRDWMLGKFGKEETDLALPSWQVDAVQEAAARGTDGTAPFSEEDAAKEDPAKPAPEETREPAAAKPVPTPAPVLSEDQATHLAKLEAREQALQEREQKLAQQEQGRTVEGYRAFCETLVRQGRPLPCSVDNVVAFMRILSGEESVSFGESETRSPLDVFKEDFLAKLPKRVDFSERAPADDQLDDEPGDPSTVAKEIVNYQESERAKGNFVTTSQAAADIKKRKQ